MRAGTVLIELNEPLILCVGGVLQVAEDQNECRLLKHDVHTM